MHSLPLLLRACRLARRANTPPPPPLPQRKQAVGLPGLLGLPEGSTIYALYAYIVLAFVVGAPKLYMHMIHQRGKQLGEAAAAVNGKVKAS